MRVTWEPVDIRSGLLVTNVATDAHNNRYMIARGVRIGQVGYVLVALSDGLIQTEPMTAGDMARKLTEGRYHPSTNREADLLRVLGRSTS